MQHLAVAPLWCYLVMVVAVLVEHDVRINHEDRVKRVNLVILINRAKHEDRINHEDRVKRVNLINYAD
jgi:hypothetical protein